MLYDTSPNMGEFFFGIFPLYDASSFLAYANELNEGTLRMNAPSFEGERRPLGASLTLHFFNTEGASSPNSQLLLRSNFSYSKH